MAAANSCRHKRLHKSKTQAKEALETKEAKRKFQFVKRGLATGVATVGHLPGNSADISAERCSS